MSNKLKEKESSEDDFIAKTILEHCGIDIKEMKKQIENMTHEDCRDFIRQTTRADFEKILEDAQPQEIE